MRLFESKLNGFRPMVMKAAWETWRRLPRQTQSWIGPDDLIQDGLEWMYRETKGRWNPDKASLSTFLHVAIEHYFYDHYIQRYGRPNRSEESGRRYGSEKRWEGRNESIQDKQQFYQERGMEFELERAMGMQVRINLPEQTLIQCAMVRTLGEMYWASSGQLRMEMMGWFLQDGKRWQLDSEKFRTAKKEFKKLADSYQVGIDDCRHIFHHFECRQELGRVVYLDGKFDLVRMRMV